MVYIKIGNVKSMIQTCIPTFTINQAMTDCKIFHSPFLFLSSFKYIDFCRVQQFKSPRLLHFNLIRLQLSICQKITTKSLLLCICHYKIVGIFYLYNIAEHPSNFPTLIFCLLRLMDTTLLNTFWFHNYIWSDMNQNFNSIDFLMIT